MARKFPRQRWLTVEQQIQGMLDLHPQLQCRRRRSAAAWIGPLRPTAIGEEYQVELTYSLETTPRIIVLSPELKGREGDTEIPHTYPGKEPCLYFPWGKDWNRGMLIAETIVPWAVHWFYHYEAWLVTGEWLGGGIHPSGGAKPTRRE